MSKFSLDTLQRRVFPFAQADDPNVIVGGTFGEDVALTRGQDDVKVSYREPFVGQVTEGARVRVLRDGQAAHYTEMRSEEGELARLWALCPRDGRSWATCGLEEESEWKCHGSLTGFGLASPSYCPFSGCGRSCGSAGQHLGPGHPLPDGCTNAWKWKMH